jgi:hypothetical protein
VVRFPTALVEALPQAPVALSRAGFEVAEPVPGALAPGEPRTRFRPAGQDARRSMADWYPQEESATTARAGVEAPPRAAPAARAGQPARARPAGPRVSRASAPPAAVAAQVRRGQLEQDVEAMLKSRLRNLRRR